MALIGNGAALNFFGFVLLLCKQDLLLTHVIGSLFSRIGVWIQCPFGHSDLKVHPLDKLEGN